MIGIYIGGPIIILIIFVSIFNYRKHKQLKTQMTELLLAYGSFDGKQLTAGNAVFDVYLFDINPRAELVINSPLVWEVHRGGHSKLIDQSYLKGNHQKIVIVYPSTKRIKRYINENTMVFVSYKDCFYHTHVVRIDELETFLKEASS